MAEADRPLRGCDVCKQVDNHPRHVLGGVKNGPGSVRHMDCCAAAGCEICQTTESYTNGARGLDLLDVIQGGALNGVEV